MFYAIFYLFQIELKKKHLELNIELLVIFTHVIKIWDHLNKNQSSQ